MLIVEIYSLTQCLSFNYSDILLQAIKRLSKDDVKLIEETCDILNRVFTKGKDLENMMEKLKDYKKEQKLNEGTCNVLHHTTFVINGETI